MMLKEDWHKDCRNLGRKGAKEIVVSLLKLGIVDTEYLGCRPLVTDQHEAKELCLTEQEREWVLEQLKNPYCYLDDGVVVKCGWLVR